MKSVDEMLTTNRRQAEFYDSIHEAEKDGEGGGYAENTSANLFTRIWAELRYRQQSAVKEAGIEEQVREFHREECEKKRGQRMLEIGCFSGSRFTLDLATISGSYVGVELSPKAVDALNSKFARADLQDKAKAVAVDFLALDETEKFDLIYAHGVLHHFENPAPLFAKIEALMKPGGVLIFAEPSMVNPIYRFLRALYRPFQSDAAWEWPFRKDTITELEKHFVCSRGFGWGAKSLPLSLLVGLPLIGRFAKKLYLSAIRSEVGKGFGPWIWWNSYVTAVYTKRNQ